MVGLRGLSVSVVSLTLGLCLVSWVCGSSVGTQPPRGSPQNFVIPYKAIQSNVGDTIGRRCEDAGMSNLLAILWPTS